LKNILKNKKLISLVLTGIAIAALAVGCFQINSYNVKIKEGESLTDQLDLNLSEALYLENVDENTGCLNLDAFRVKFDSTVSEMKDGDQKALINLSFGSQTNGLKFINDTYGHIYGNQTVKLFAEMVQSIYSGDDYVYGYPGGSNFYVLVNDASDTDALLAKAETFKEKWHDTPLVLDDNVKIENMALHISIALIPKDGTQFDDIKVKLGINKDKLRAIDSYGCSFVD
jgi:diguanylate cyclase (GGDEF)-like protein